MKTHGLGIYPMYLTEKVLKVENDIIEGCLITCYSLDKIEVGDIYTHKFLRNDFNVSEVQDHKFPDKGNHDQQTHWYKLLLKK